MPTLEVEDHNEVILVEFAPTPGVRGVGLSPGDVAEKSKEAIDDALNSMRTMAKKTVKAIKEIPLTERPHTIAVSFGLKLNAEGTAVVAKVGAEAAITVTMTWQRTASGTTKAKRGG